jgi:hypothetical protein
MNPVTAYSPGQLSVDPRWFRALNAFALAPWRHAPDRAYARYGVVLLALMLLGGWRTAQDRRDMAGLSAALRVLLAPAILLGAAVSLVAYLPVHRLVQTRVMVLAAAPDRQLAPDEAPTR